MIVETDPARLYWLLDAQPSTLFGQQTTCSMTDEEKEAAAKASKNPIGFVWPADKC